MKIIEGGYDDKPISGPWDRPGTGGLPEESPESLGENDQKDNTGFFELEIPPQDPPTAYQEYNEYNEAQKEKDLDVNEKQHLPEPGVFKASDAAGKRRDRTGFLQKLLTPEGIYSGLVMSEILGHRKGLRRRR